MARKPIDWTINLNGVSHDFSYQFRKGQHHLSVDGQEHAFKNSFKSSFMGLDEPFTLDGHPARLVMNGRKPDIVIDDVYVSDGRKYVPFPGWCWIFVVLNFLLVIGLGAIPFLLAFLGVAGCNKASRAASIPLAGRVILCVLITGAMYGIFAVIFGVALVAQLATM